MQVKGQGKLQAKLGAPTLDLLMKPFSNIMTPLLKNSSCLKVLWKRTQCNKAIVLWKSRDKI